MDGWKKMKDDGFFSPSNLIISFPALSAFINKINHIYKIISFKLISNSCPNSTYPSKLICSVCRPHIQTYVHARFCIRYFYLLIENSVQSNKVYGLSHNHFLGRHLFTACTVI